MLWLLFDRFSFSRVAGEQHDIDAPVFGSSLGCGIFSRWPEFGVTGG